MRPHRLPVRLRLALWYGLAVLLAGGTVLTGAVWLATRSFESYEARVDRLLTETVVARLETVRTDRERVALLQLMPVQKAKFLDPSAGADPLAAEQRQILETARADAAAAQRTQVLVLAGAGLLGLVVLSGAAGYVLAGRALRPVSQITAAAQEISIGALDRRIGAAGPRDELRALAETFDEMLDRLDAGVKRQRRFAATASHELRTPLTVMRTAIDVALDAPDAAPTPRIRRMVATLRGSLERCERLVERLLVLARGDLAADDSRLVAMDELAGRHADEAERQGLRVHKKLLPTSVAGDPVLLDHLVRNLVENGCRHGGGELTIATRPAEHGSVLEVLSDGREISASELATFGAGRGIGLTLVRSIADAHGGSVELARRPAGGLRVSVALPPAPA